MHHGVSKMALYIELEENVKVNFNPPQFLHCTRGVNSIRTREWLPIFASETHDFIVDEDYIHLTLWDALDVRKS